MIRGATLSDELVFFDESQHRLGIVGEWWIHRVRRSPSKSDESTRPAHKARKCETHRRRSIVEKWVEKGSIMVTDSHKGYIGLKDYFHVALNHIEGEYVRGAFTSNKIENFWSIFKRGIIGIYHQVSVKHLHRYTTEFGYRYNNRENTGAEKFKLAVSKSAQKRLSYDTLTGKDANPLYKLNPNDPNIPTYVEKGYEHLEDIDPQNV